MDKSVEAMREDLGLIRVWADDTPVETLQAEVVEIWHRQVHLAGRLDTLAAAMDRVFPEWRMDNACLPNCQGACCQD